MLVHVRYASECPYTYNQRHYENYTANGAPVFFEQRNLGIIHECTFPALFEDSFYTIVLPDG